MPDYFNRDTTALQHKRFFLLDMDGTLYNGMQLFPQSMPFLKEIKARGGQYRFITNNSSKSVEAYLTKLQTLGIAAQPEEFYTSSQATVYYILNKHPKELVYCMGTQSLINELKKAGIDVTTARDENATVLLMGYDTELTYQKLEDMSYLLGDQKRSYIATNCDLVCPTEFGFVPDCGSFSIMLKNATGRQPLFIGKPAPAMLEFCMDEAGATREETVVIGDRLYTDIAAGASAHVTSVLVLSGEATLEELNHSPVKADFVLEHIGQYWQ